VTLIAWNFIDPKAQAALMASQREINVSITRRKHAEAALAQATADRDIAKFNLGYTELREPIAGIEGKRIA
jgi:membrane fusion protein (multidrug efflux system)